MRRLTMKHTLEFYDVPQLFVAADTLNTHYLCVLFSQAESYEYLGVQVSELKLRSFMAGEIDLRMMYEDPEADDSLYHVTVQDKTITADKLLSKADITNEMLPEPGFYYEPEEAVETTETDTILIDLPSSDRRMFTDMSKRMGWITSIMKDAAHKIAVL